MEKKHCNDGHQIKMLIMTYIGIKIECFQVEFNE